MEGLFCYILWGVSNFKFLQKNGRIWNPPLLNASRPTNLLFQILFRQFKRHAVVASHIFLPSQALACQLPPGWEPSQCAGGYAISCPQFNRREQAPALRYGKHFAGVNKKVGEDIILPHKMFCINISISNFCLPIQTQQRCSPFVILSVAHRDSTRLRSCFWVPQKFDKLRMTPCGVGGRSRNPSVTRIK